jgi:hypothetical protein
MAQIYDPFLHFEIPFLFLNLQHFMNFSHTIAFYNLENLFDPEDGEHTLDTNFTPQGSYRWNQGKYQRKIDNLGKVISEIGPKKAQNPPVFLGVCEVENQSCLKDLINCDALYKYDYSFVHYESDDRRGLDTAFLYRTSHFKLKGSETFSIEVEGRTGREPTRDILHVEGDFFGERIHVLVNHWPSRLEGSRSTRNKRRSVARELDKIVVSIYEKDPNSKILIVGDFNDQPNDYSLRRDFSHDFFNASDQDEFGPGTVRFKNKWVVFDQILLDPNLLKNTRLNYKASGVYCPPYLIESSGRHRGSPKRSIRGRRFQDGYSDHLPVYVVFDVPQ